MEIEVDSVKTKQKALDHNFTSLEQNSVFVEEQVQELIAKSLRLIKTMTMSAIHAENCYTWKPTVDVKT